MHQYVYHHVPAQMFGTVLYPLNRLLGIDRKLYELYKSGYQGREQLLQRKIPYLDCLWNDVLHCSPVHPAKINQALKSCGVKDIPSAEFFEVDVESDIDMTNSVIFYRSSNKPGDIYFEKAWEAKWDSLGEITELSLKHYRDVAANGEPLFAYHGLPHFLYLGEIEIRNLRRIKT